MAFTGDYAELRTVYLFCFPFSLNIRFSFWVFLGDIEAMKWVQEALIGFRRRRFQFGVSRSLHAYRPKFIELTAKVFRRLFSKYPSPWSRPHVVAKMTHNVW